MSRDCESDLTDPDLASLDPSTSSHLLSRTIGSATATSLYPYIHLSRSHSLNTLPPPDGLPLVLRPYDARNRVSSDQSLFSLDGSDAEVIAQVAFSEPVRVKQLVINVGRGEEAPRVCKVWVNRAEGIGFEEVDEIKTDQEWEMLEGDEAIEYPTRLSKFHSVSTLTFHFSNPSGGDRCRIFYLGFLGEAKQLKKDSAPQLDVGAANAADAAIDRVRSQMGGSQTTIR